MPQAPGDPPPPGPDKIPAIMDGGAGRQWARQAADFGPAQPVAGQVLPVGVQCKGQTKIARDQQPDAPRPGQLSPQPAEDQPVGGVVVAEDHQIAALKAGQQRRAGWALPAPVGDQHRDPAWSPPLRVEKPAASAMMAPHIASARFQGRGGGRPRR